MNQSLLYAGALIAAFVMYVIINGRAGVYLAIMGLGGSSPAPAAGSSPLVAGAAQLGAYNPFLQGAVPQVSVGNPNPISGGRFPSLFDPRVDPQIFQSTPFIPGSGTSYLST